MFALPIFTASHPATIVGANELNFCVRNGNRWTLIAINTNYLLVLPVHYSTAFALCQVLFLTQLWVVTRGRVELPFAA